MPRFVSLLTSLSLLFSNAAYGLDEVKAQQCVVDMCGPAKHYLPIRAEGVFVTAVPEDVKKTIKETEVSLNQLISKSITKTQFRDEIIGQMTNQDLQKLPTVQLSIIKMFSLFEVIKPVFNKIIDSEDGTTIMVSLEKAKKELPNVDKNFLENAVRSINAYLNDPSYRMIDFADSTPLDLFFRQLVSSTYGVSKQNFLEMYIVSLGSFREIFGEAFFEQKEIELLKKYKNGVALSGYEQKRASKIISQYYAFNVLTSNKVQETLLGLPISKEDVINFRSLKASAQSQSSQKIAIEKEKIIAYCNKKIAQYFSAIPSDFKIKKANEWLEKLKAASKKVAAKYLFKKDLEDVYKGIDKLTLVRNDSVKNHEQNLKEAFSEALEHAERRVDHLSQAKNRNNFWLGLAVALNGDDEENESVFSDVRNFCEELEPSGFSDSAYEGVKEFKTSWQSIMFPEIGVGVMAHEIGHIVSFYVRQNRDGNLYNQVKECSKERHEKLLKSQSEYAGSWSQYGEEDWADEFAAAVINELKTDLPFLQNYNCALINVDKKTEEYKEPKLFDLSGTDTHSTAFLRAIRTHVQMGHQLPQSCKAAMGPEITAIATKSCQAP